MLVGHFAPALAIRAATPRVPLWALILGTQAVDVLFFAFVLGGVESASIEIDGHPQLTVTQGIYTHSLLMTGGYFGLCLGAGALLRRWREGALIGLAVASHWFADLIVHVPDLPLTFDQQSAVGLGLWRIAGAATALEIGLVAVGALLLYRSYEGVREKRRLVMFAGGLAAVQLVSDLVFPTPATDVELAPAAWALYAAATGAALWVERSGEARTDAAA